MASPNPKAETCLVSLLPLGLVLRFELTWRSLLSLDRIGPSPATEQDGTGPQQQQQQEGRSKRPRAAHAESAGRSIPGSPSAEEQKDVRGGWRGQGGDGRRRPSKTG
jgi:hypothetical protein